MSAFDYTETDAHERLHTRLQGLNALAHIARMAGDSEPAQKVLDPLFYFIVLPLEDAQRDLAETIRSPE